MFDWFCRCDFCAASRMSIGGYNVKFDTSAPTTPLPNLQAWLVVTTFGDSKKSQKR